MEDGKKKKMDEKIDAPNEPQREAEKKKLKRAHRKCSNRISLHLAGIQNRAKVELHCQGMADLPAAT